MLRRKSSKVNWPLRSCASHRRPAPRARPPASARSISVSTSPMPRIRDAIRSGWNALESRRASRPSPANMIGLPVTALTESAAPPRASPSSFVSTTPSNAIRSCERLGDVRRPPGRSSRRATSSDVRRLDRVAHAGELVHQRRRRSGGGRRCRRSPRSRPSARALARARRRGTRPGPACRVAVDRHADLPPSCSSCSIAAGRWRSAATSRACGPACAR